MGNEAIKTHTTGTTVDGYVFRRSDGSVWYPVGVAFELWGTNGRAAADYKSITMTEVAAGGGFYTGNFPTAITTAAQYDIQYRQRAGANPANSDTILKPLQPVFWSGTSDTGGEIVNSVFYTHTTGVTLDGYIFRRSDGKVWYATGAVFETWGTSSRTAADYELVMTEEASGSGYYLAAFPTAILTEVQYDVQFRVRAGGSPANSDTILTPLLEIFWTGTDDNVADRTALANYALAKVGGGGSDVKKYRIGSINDDESTARAMREMEDQIRKEVMTRAFWSSATKYAELGAEVDVERADWLYAFNLPSDYLGRCQQINEDFHRTTRPRFLHQFDKEIVQGRIFTNHFSNSDNDSAFIRYIFDLTNVAKLDTHLYNAIATKWASEMANLLTGDGGVRRRDLLLEYEDLVLDIAQGEDAIQQGDNFQLGRYSAIDVRYP